MMTEIENSNDTPVELDSIESVSAESVYDEVASQDGQAGLEATPKQRKKYGKFALGFTALSALIIGGASGGGFVQYVMPHVASQDSAAPSKSVDLTPLETQIAQLTEKNAKVEARLTKLDAAIGVLEKAPKPAKTPAAKPANFSKDLKSLKSRLKTLETAPKQAVIDEGLLERLETLQDSGSPALDLSAIEDRLTELEAVGQSGDIPEATQESLQDIYEKQAETDNHVEAQIAALTDDLKSTKVKLEDTQTRLTKVSAGQAAVKAAAQLKPATKLPFPKQAMLDAIDAQAQKKPLLKRALSKHIKVKDPSDPSVIIGAIETDLAKGEIDAVIARFDALPPEIRSAAKAWRDSLN